MTDKNQTEKEGSIQQEFPEETPGVAEEMSLISIPSTPRVIDIDKEIDRIEKNIEFFNKIKLTSLKLTKPSDWVFQQEGPYLMDRGAENIAIAWGVDISDVKMRMEWAEDDKGRYYTFVATGKAYSKRLGRYIEDIGVCSQRDKLFGMIKGEFKSIEEIDMANIRRKAITNLHSRLIKRIIGLMSITEDDLKEAGIDTSKIKRIEYKSGSKKTEKTATESEKKRQKDLWDMLIQHTGGADDVARDILKEQSGFTAEDGKVIEGKTDVKYLTGKWLNFTYKKIKELTQERQPGEDE